ncbi:hypothetical protein GCM10017779_06710 [Streptomyces capillispiralis]|nr:hypothetical protein GCM10017779_06710 [Streptomyces capillispiralis]
MTPGSSTDLSRSPAATRTAAASESALAGGTDGSSVEDMRQCYETITPWFMCSPSQTVPAPAPARAPGCARRHIPVADRMASGSGVS